MKLLILLTVIILTISTPAEAQRKARYGGFGVAAAGVAGVVVGSALSSDSTSTSTPSSPVPPINTHRVSCVREFPGHCNIRSHTIGYTELSPPPRQEFDGFRASRSWVAWVEESISKCRADFPVNGHGGIGYAADWMSDTKRLACRIGGIVSVAEYLRVHGIVNKKILRTWESGYFIEIEYAD